MQLVPQVSIWISTLVFVLLHSLIYVQGKIYYCLRDEAVALLTNESGTIKTLYEGQNVYDNNQRCTWIIDAGQGDNRRISLKIIKSHLEWAPDMSTCHGYDFIEVSDGKSTESESIVKWCGEQKPYAASSSGRYLHITFHSNEKNIYEYGGAIIEFTIYETANQLGGCQPGWFDYQDKPEGGDMCFNVKSHKESWIDAQRYCQYEQANLVKITTNADADLLNGVLKNTTHVRRSENIWLGLNDIVIDTEYRWMDSELLKMSPTRWRTQPHVSDEFLNCVTMKSEDGLWAEDFCNENNVITLVKFKFVCEKKKVGHTVLYSVPNERKNKPGGLSDFPVVVWIVPVAVICLLIIIIIGVVVYKRGRAVHISKRIERTNQRNQNQDQRAHSLRQHPGTQVQPRVPPYSGGGNSLEETSFSPYNIDVERRHSPPPSYDATMGQTSAVCKS